MAQPKVLSDKDIVTRVDQQAKESAGWYDSRLSKERERVMKYYNATLPARQHEGSSSYISTDVYDSVEMMKAQLLEVFSGSDEIAQFDPDSDMSVEDCREATEACRYAIFRENDAFNIFQTVQHDGLTARVGIAKVYWDEKFEYEDEEFHNLPEADAHALAAQDDVDEFEAKETEVGSGIFEGHLSRKYDCSQVRIETIAPEEFLIKPRAKSIAKADYCGHRTLKTKADLKDMGLDPTKVDEVHYDDAKGLDMSPEVLARFAPIESASATDDAIQPELEKVMLYESYVRMQIDKKKGVRLYKVLHASDTLFDYEEVDRAPFLAYAPLPVPHAFFGNNYAARVIPTQNARSVLTRSVLDHAMTTNNPRWGVVKGGLLNPKEMLDNRKGGLVNVSRPDSIFPLPVANLNPYVFEVLGMLKDDKEQSTGISSLSQGLNKDAISNQNSGALVDNLVTLSGQRQKIAARNFAFNFFIPLMLEVMRLLCLNASRPKMIEVCGQWKQVDPRKWTERTTATVSMHLGYGEKDQHAGKLTELYKGLSADPAMANMFDQQGRYNLMRDICKVTGLTNITSYLKTPQQAKPLQPDPFKTQELQIKNKLADATVLTAQSQQQRDQRVADVDAGKLHQQQQKIFLQALDHDRDNTRQDTETAARIDVANREMTLEESMPDTSRKAIVSPHP